jgi:hypothetical protein
MPTLYESDSGVAQKQAKQAWQGNSPCVLQPQNVESGGGCATLLCTTPVLE